METNFGAGKQKQLRWMQRDDGNEADEEERFFSTQHVFGKFNYTFFFSLKLSTVIVVIVGIFLPTPQTASSVPTKFTSYVCNTDVDYMPSCCYTVMV